jgi:hypothetical protein
MQIDQKVAELIGRFPQKRLLLQSSLQTPGFILI